MFRHGGGSWTGNLDGREILKDLAPSFPRGLEWQLHVSNDSKMTVLKLKFSLEEPVLTGIEPLPRAVLAR